MTRYATAGLRASRRGLLADVVERADVGVIELGDCAGFTIEALAELRIDSERPRQDLDRDEAIQPRVARLVDLAHPARAEGGHDFVGSELEAGGQRHGWVILQDDRPDSPSVNGIAADGTPDGRPSESRLGGRIEN